MALVQYTEWALGTDELLKFVLCPGGAEINPSCFKSKQPVKKTPRACAYFHSRKLWQMFERKIASLSFGFMINVIGA